MTKEWKKKVKDIGELIDESDKKIVELTDEVDKVNDNLLRSNKQLKNIIEKYSKPHKFCIDIVLILLLVGMIVGIIQLSKSWYLFNYFVRALKYELLLKLKLVEGVNINKQIIEFSYHCWLKLQTHVDVRPLFSLGFLGRRRSNR